VLLLSIVLGGGHAAWAQPPNLGDLKTQLLQYVQSGDYDRELAEIAVEATTYVESHAKYVAKPAIVLDIDETSLSNWPEIKVDDFGFILNGPCSNPPQGPCGNDAWTTLAAAAPITPTLRLFNDARSLGVAVFFITGRHESQRTATERNLARAGYAGWTALMMEPDDVHPKSAADFKTPARAKVEALGYHIIANVGDQPSDLDGGHADQTFQLPDPFYRIP